MLLDFRISYVRIQTINNNTLQGGQPLCSWSAGQGKENKKRKSGSTPPRAARMGTSIRNTSRKRSCFETRVTDTLHSIHRRRLTSQPDSQPDRQTDRQTALGGTSELFRSLRHVDRRNILCKRAQLGNSVHIVLSA